MSGRRAPLFQSAAAILLLLLAFTGTLEAGNVEFVSVQQTVSSIEQSRSFYQDTLQFTFAGESRVEGGVTATMRLGEETLLLFAPDKKGQPIPPAMQSNDRLFQHLAIVVSDMEAACRRLRDHGTSFVSAGPQTLPRWNFDSADIRALYFRDPDGHFLELIQFPSNKGEPKWHRGDGRLFLGIDHTAIVVRDMKASRHFYRDLLGLTIVGESLNYGGEQELLSGVPRARVKITGFRGVKGPGVELLHYETPEIVEAFPGTLAPNGLLYWQINLYAEDRAVAAVRVNSISVLASALRSPFSEVTGRMPVPLQAPFPVSDLRSPVSLDPDGHALSLSLRSADAPTLEYMGEALRQHWTRYLMEGAELGIFMIVALYLTIAMEHPQSPIHRAIKSGLMRRALLGLGIGVTVIALIYCQWGRLSGAQFNPAVTLARLSLTRIEPWDAVFYIIAQFLGGWLLLFVAGLPARRAAAHVKVKWVVTAPGPKGVAAAFIAEFFISFLILFSLLLTFHSAALKPWIGVVAGLHLAAFIAFEAPFSGMSLNPARSVASAFPARSWKAMWIYFVAPPLAMFLAARVCRWMVDS